MRRDWNILRRDRSVGSRYAIEVRNKYEALAEVAEDEGVNRDWRILQDSLVDSAEKLITRERKRRRQSWMTEEILDFMEQRRRMKSQSIDRYKDLDRLVKTMCKERKEEWLRERCQEMEQLERVDLRLMAEKIREITGQKSTTRSTIVKDRNGNILTERIDVLNRWREYVEGLYRDDRGEKPEFDGCEPGPPILRNEIEKAVRGMEWRKAEDSDGIVVEMLEAEGDFTIRKITELANKIYETGVLPNRMQESEFIVIPKKVGAVDCEKHRTISITSQVAK